ncbi:hypothetical protein GF356_07740 [candidate division GN15 bacterium]|nr:hypothetical protein [candidate division GN15 bacterium]
MYSEPTTQPQEANQQDQQSQSTPLRIPRGYNRCLVTFEISETWAQWTATPHSRRKRSEWVHQRVPIGYGEPDRLAGWFDEFWTLNGDRPHEVHLLVSGPEMLQRSFFVPEVPAKELPAVVKSQAKHVFPFDIRRGLFSFKQIDRIERAGVPTLEIHALALGDTWPVFIQRMFGKWLANVTLITSSGQKAELWLSRVGNTFTEEDTLLVRLRDNVLETAFYRKGQQEFYRETVVDSLPSADFNPEATTDGQSADQTNPRVFGDMRRIIRDALDYYLGQTPDRHIQTVYLCLPPSYDEEINLYVDTELGARAVGIASPSYIEQHLEQTGIHQLSSQYCSLCSLLPPVGQVDSLLNLLPRQVEQARRVARIKSSGSVALAAGLLAMVVISALQYLDYRQTDTLVNVQLSQVANLEQHPLITELNQTTRQAGMLRGDLQPFDRQPDPGMRYALQVLSSVARDGIALDNIRMTAEPGGGCILTVKGQVTSGQGHHESALYAYLVDLKSIEGIGRVDLLSKNTTEQFGERTVHFAVEVEVGR